MYTDEQILSLFDYCDLEDLSETSWHYTVVPQLSFGDFGIPEEMFERYTAGASKGVIFIKDWDWVIKVPFIFSEGEEYPHNSCIRPSYADSMGEYHSGIYEDTSWRYTPGEPFEGADNLENNWDYCQKEYEVYKDAEAAGVENFFLEVRRVGFSKESHPIYIQKRADDIGIDCVYNDKDIYKPEDIETAKSISASGGAWIGWEGILLALFHHGREKAEKLVDFIREHCIGDLHYSNMGTLNGNFVLIDYSDFNG